MTFAELGLSDSLRQALIEWQAEGCGYEGADVDRSEDEFERAGARLAARLAAETGLPVDLEV
jgi:hypothetical protein